MTKNTEHSPDVGGQHIRAADREWTTSYIELHPAPPFRGLEKKRKGPIIPADAHPTPPRRPPQGQSQYPLNNPSTQLYGGRQGNTPVSGYGVTTPYQQYATGSSSGSTSSQPHGSYAPGFSSGNIRPGIGTHSTLYATSDSLPREPNPWADLDSSDTVAPGLGRATTVPANVQYHGSELSSTSTAGSSYGTTINHVSGQGPPRAAQLASRPDDNVAYENRWHDPSPSSPSHGNLGRAATVPGGRMCRHGVSGGSSCSRCARNTYPTR